MASKRMRSAYAGALAKPIKLPSSPRFTGLVHPRRVAAYRKLQARHERAATAVLAQEYLRKLPLLFEHYGITDNNDMAALVLALAHEHVPGFKVLQPLRRSKRGAKPKWDSDRLDSLLETVESIKLQHPKFSDRRALRYVVGKPPYAAIWGKSTRSGSTEKRVETLETRLQQAKKIKKDARKVLLELEQLKKILFRK